MESGGFSHGLLLAQSILGLLTLSLLDPYYLCAGQVMKHSNYCDERTEANIFLNCNNTRVIRVERVYFGATPSLKCPPPHNCGTFDIEETERLRINCNRLSMCTTPANFPSVDCEGTWVNSTSVFVTYQCVEVTYLELAALTTSSQTAFRPIVWLLTKAHPPDADSIYRQMCRIRTQRPDTVLVDFLDLSHDEDTASEIPYCVYWPGSHTCAEKASSRQIFFVHNTSMMSPFTLLFWSNNYTTTTTARFWIAIRARRNSTRVSAECGLSVLDDPTVTTPEPYRLGEPGSAGGTSIAAVISGTLAAVVLLGILVAVLYVCLYRRPKKQQSTTAGTTLAGLTTSAIYSISRDDDYEHVASSGGETGTTDYENLKSREERQLPDYVNLESRAESQLPSSTHGQQQ